MSSYTDDSDDMVAEPVAGAFFNCKMDAESLTADTMEKAVGVSCHVTFKNPVFDWQFFCKDKNGMARELAIYTQASEQVSECKSLVLHEVFDPKQSITIMARSNSSLANGMPAATDSMQAIESIPSASVDDFMGKMRKN